MKTRVYIVRIGGEERLVRATNRNRAISHVAHNTITCDVASQDDLINLVGNGTAIEIAGLETLEPQ